MKILKHLSVVIVIVALIGCNNAVQNHPEADTNQTNIDAENQLLKFENVDGIDFSDIKYIPLETDKDTKLEEAFAKVYDLKRGDDKIRYYYNQIDLNSDKKLETFVLLVGPSVCGTGGCSALIFEKDEDEYKLVSRFTLVNNPIIISESKTNGWNDIIMNVSGGGSEEFFSVLKFDGKQYPLNPSTQPKLKSGSKVQGTAIIAEDISKNLGIEF